MISFLVGCKKCKSSTYKLASRACGMRHKKKVCDLDFNLWKSNLNERTILRVRRCHGLGNEEKKNASNNGVCKLHLQLKIELPSVGDSLWIFKSSCKRTYNVFFFPESDSWLYFTNMTESWICMMNEFLMAKDQRSALISASELSEYPCKDPSINITISIFHFPISYFPFSVATKCQIVRQRPAHFSAGNF